jgi:hypothetical protein
MPSSLTSGHKKLILGLSFLIWFVACAFAMYHIWSPAGWLAQTGTLLKVVATVLAFPVCVLATLLAGILIQAVVELVTAR